MASESFAPSVGWRFTAADLAVFPTSLPSGDVDYELDQGRLVLMVPPGHPHGLVQLQIAGEFLIQGQRAGFGQAVTDEAVVLSRNPDTVLSPDVAFISKSKLPVRVSREGYLETIPDIVVEVRSKNDTHAELERKAETFLSAGVGLVLIADPEAKTIAAFRAGAERRVYFESDTFALDDPIPGFRLSVREVFRS
jgi:Uma2 family endonuclease